MCSDQALHHHGIPKRLQGGKLGDKTNHQDERTIGAEPAVEHDLELRRRITATTEPVGDIGQSILVQRTGQDRARAQGQRRRPEVGQPHCPHREIQQSNGAADCCAYHRKHPMRADEIRGLRAIWMRHRQPGQKGHRGSQVV